MKYAIKILAMISVLTASLVVYVYGQTAIFQVSYELNAKADILELKKERYRHLKYDVDKLRAPGLLAQKMKAFDIPLDLPRNIELVRIPVAPAFTKTAGPDIAAQSLGTGRLDFLGRWVKVAQAKMDS